MPKGQELRARTLKALGHKRLRRCRYRGEAKTRLQNIITAAAINLVRVWDWWCGTSSKGNCPFTICCISS